MSTFLEAMKRTFAELKKGQNAQMRQDPTLRHFELPWRVRTPILLVSLALGVFVYAVWFVDGRYESVYRTYREANAIHELFREDPSLSHEAALNRTLFARWLLLSGLSEELPDTMAFTADGGQEYSLVGSILFPANEAPIPFGAHELRTVDLLVYLAQELGSDTAGGASSAEFRDSVSAELSASLAGVPGVRMALWRTSFGERWHRALEAELTDPAHASGALLDAEFDGTPGFWTLRFMPTRPLRDAEQLELLNQTTSVIGPGGLASDLAELAATPLGAEQLAFAERFSLELISRLHAHPDVKAAKRWQTLFQGPEQCLMLIVAMAMLMALTVRAAHRVQQAHKVADFEDALQGLIPGAEGAADSFHKVLTKRAGTDSATEVPVGQAPPPHEQKTIPGYFAAVGLSLMSGGRGAEAASGGSSLAALTDLEKSRIHNSRWPIRYAARALPALGFIGTVRGILFALSDADSIVRATNQASQAAAVASVSSTLGLAFGTTLIALVMGLVLGVMNDSQTAREFESVDRVEEALLPAWSRFVP